MSSHPIVQKKITSLETRMLYLETPDCYDVVLSPFSDEESESLRGQISC